jgi:hypothetical protein
MRPSGAGLWGSCSAAPSMASQVPHGFAPEDTEARRRGNAGHWVVESVLLAFRDGAGEPLLPAQYVGREAPNGYIIDQEIADGAQVVTDDVLKVCNEFGALRALLIEHRLGRGPLEGLVTPGTLDIGLIVPEAERVFIWDAKFGRRLVRAENSKQLSIYCANLLVGKGLDFSRYALDLRIVQPFTYRATGPVDVWRCSVDDVAVVVQELKVKAQEAHTSPVATSGPHCVDCPGRATCATAIKADAAMFDYVDAPPVAADMSGHDLGVEFAALSAGIKRAEARRDDIEAMLLAGLSRGQYSDSGYAVGTGRGSDEFTKSDEVVKATVAAVGVKATKDVMLTPNQLKQAMPLALRSVVDGITRRKAGKQKLIRAEDSIISRAFKPKKES